MMLLHTGRSTDVLKMKMKSHFGKMGEKMEETHTVTLAEKKPFLIVAFQSHDKRSSPKKRPRNLESGPRLDSSRPGDTDPTSTDVTGDY